MDEGEFANAVLSENNMLALQIESTMEPIAQLLERIKEKIIGHNTSWTSNLRCLLHVDDQDEQEVHGHW